MATNQDNDAGEFPTAFFLAPIKRKLIRLAGVLAFTPIIICGAFAYDMQNTGFRWLCIAGAVLYSVAIASFVLWFDDRKRKKATGK